MNPGRRRLLWPLLLALAALALALLGRGLLQPAAPTPPPPQGLATAPLPPSRGGLTLRGRVVDAHGAPVDGATVIATAGGEALSLLQVDCRGDSYPLPNGECPRTAERLAELASRRDAEAPAQARTLSLPDGSFSLEGLSQGRYDVWAEEARRGIALLRDAEAGAEGLTLRLSPGVFLDARAVGDRGEPLEGAQVTALTHEHRRFFDARSDADGRVHLGPVPEGVYVLVASSPGRFPAFANASVRKPPTLVLRQPLGLKGRVVRDGRPVPGAQVTLDRGHHTTPLQTTSDEAGRFAVDGLPSGTYGLTATAGNAQGRASVKREPGGPSDEVELLLEEGVSLSGVVRDQAGQPIAGADVHPERGSARAVRSGPDGRYRFTALPPGEYEVWAEARGYRDPRARKSLELAAGEHAEVDLTLKPGAEISGQVVDESGHPVPYARVEARGAVPGPGDEGPGAREEEEGDDAPDDSVQFLLAGGDGRFELTELRPGARYVLSASSAQHRYLPSHLEVQAPAEGAQLRLAAGARLTGRIVDPRGAAVPLAYVFAHRTSPASPPVSSGTQADEFGRFTLSDLLPGHYRVEVLARIGMNRHAEREVDLGAEAVTELDVRVGSGHALAGRVVDGDGRPIDEATVRAMPLTPEGATDKDRTLLSPGEVVTGADGLFEFGELNLAPYALYAERRGYENPEIVEARPEGAPVTLVLRAPPHLRLRVLRGDGHPISNCSVDTLGAYRGTAEADGTYDVVKPYASEHVRISAPGYAPEQVTFTEEDLRKGEREVILRPGRRLTGRVVDAVTGAPVPGASLRLSPERTMDEPPVDAHAGPDGEFTLAHVGDEGALEVQAPGYVTGNPPLSPGQDTASIRLEPLASLTVVVRAPPEELSRLHVVLRSAGQESRAPHHLDSTDGEFLIDGLRADTYAVVLERHVSDAPPQETVMLYVHLAPGQARRVELTPP